MRLALHVLATLVAASLAASASAQPINATNCASQTLEIASPNDFSALEMLENSPSELKRQTANGLAAHQRRARHTCQMVAAGFDYPGCVARHGGSTAYRQLRASEVLAAIGRQTQQTERLLAAQAAAEAACDAEAAAR
jgi:hypothetical protein